MTRLADRRWAAPLAAAALLVLMVAVSRDFGATWDERFQQFYGEQIRDYLHGRLPRATFDDDFANQHLYGGFFELVAVTVQRAVPADVYVVRHAVNSVFGWIGIVCGGLLAARLFGTRAGWLAGALLALSPRYFGDAMNNPKDVPFAAFALVALYFVLTVRPRPPHLTAGHAAKLTAAIALAISVRPLGLSLLAYAALVLAILSALAIWQAPAGERPWRGVIGAAGWLALIALVAIPAGTVAWPWAQAQPFSRPVEAFLVASRATWAAGFGVLYGGEYLGADSLPWHYVPLWLLMSTPPVVIAGILLSPLAWTRGPVARAGLLALAAFVIVPIASAIIRHATLYNAIRHLLFVVPPLTVLAAAGWVAALGAARGRVRTAALVLLVAGLAEPFIFQIRNHPNQATYFSPIVGGPRAAYGRYDMDYWGNSMLQAVKWTARMAERTGAPLGVDGRPAEPLEADLARFPSLWFAGRQPATAHFVIRLLSGPGDAIRELAGRRDVLFRVTTADGTPLCVVLPGPAYRHLTEQVGGAGAPR